MADLVNAVPISKFKYPESIYIGRLRIPFEATGYKKLNEIKYFPNYIGEVYEQFVTSTKLA